MGKPCNAVTGNYKLHKVIDVLPQSYGLFCGKEAVQLKQDKNVKCVGCISIDLHVY